MATGSYFTDIRTVGIKVLKNKLSEYVCLAAAGDALHVATLVYVRQTDVAIELASYDKQMLAAARALDIRSTTCDRAPAQ
jgi:hypothetical protein